MKITHYKEIFRLSAGHSYFSSGMCMGLTFTPGGFTRNLMKRYGLLCRPLPGGFGWYADTPGSIADLLNTIAKNTEQNYFEFDIEATEDFYTYTDLPLDQQASYIFSSRNTLKDDSGNSWLETETTAKGQCFGKIIFYFDDLTAFAGNPCPAHYKIGFNAVGTQWQYYIINRSETTLNNPAIKGKGEVDFTGPDHVTVANGEMALLFTTGNTLLTLTERPQYSFNLVCPVKNSSTGLPLPKDKIIYKGLPTPDPAHKGYAINAGRVALSSPMYVYI